MLKSVDDLFGEVSLEFAGAAKPVVLNEIRKAARAFFNDSEVWIETLAAIDAAADQTDFTLAVDQHAIVKRVTKLRYGDPAALDSDTIPASHFQLLPAGTLRLDDAYSTSSATTGYLLPEVVLVPARNSYEAPERLVDMYGDAILAKLRSTMLMQNGTPWFDPNSAAYWIERYRILLGEAKADAVQPGTKGLVRCNLPTF